MNKANRKKEKDQTITFIAAFKHFTFYECGLQWSRCTMRRNNRVKFDKMYRNFDGSSKVSARSFFLSVSLHLPPSPLVTSHVHICNEFIMHLYLFSRFATPIGQRIFICIERTCSFAFLPLFINSLHLSSLLAALSPSASQTNAENVRLHKQLYKWIVTKRNENYIFMKMARNLH